MNRKTQFGIAGGALVLASALGVALINRKPAVDAELRRDLAMALDTTGLELAPVAGNRTQFVSALERNDADRAPSPTPSPKRRAPVRRPVRAAPVESPTPVVVQAASGPEVVTAESDEAGTQEMEPQPTPVEVPREAIPAPTRSPDRFPSPAPRSTRRGGGGWTTADVIRNAPFPINPLAGKR